MAKLRNPALWLIVFAVAYVAAVANFGSWFDKHAGSVQAALIGILVIVTAFYAWQTKQQADASVRMAEDAIRASKSSTFSSIMSRLDGINRFLVERGAQIYASLRQPYEGSEDTDYDDPRSHWMDWQMTCYEELWIQKERFRLFDEEYFKTWIPTIRSDLNYRYVRERWKSVGKGASYVKDFSDFIDRLILEIEETKK